MNILIIIPARGNSKGIPRKNLRSLNGKPLVHYSIIIALKSKYSSDVYVTSEDDEILSTSKKSGAKVVKREELNLSSDNTTLDPVIYHAYKHVSKSNKLHYDIIVTLQPTSPLLKTSSLDKAIEKMINNPGIDTIISAVDDTHLTWRFEDEKFIPNYTERINRQHLPQIYKETGGFLITRSNIISEKNRIGEKTELYILPKNEAIDIDTYEEWNICEYYLKRKNILFVVTGNRKNGLGHIYNTLTIANDILNHKIQFLVDKESDLGYEVLIKNNYSVTIQRCADIIEDILDIKPDIVINDILDTEEKYVKRLKQEDITVINFEDLGKGAKYANLAINAIYPESEIYPDHYYGAKYFCARNEFLVSEKKEVKPEVRRILITFGGVDSNNYTYKVLHSVYDYCDKNNIVIDVITGFGYDKFDTLKEFPNSTIHRNISNISDFMLSADLIFTSAGRTIFEIACIGTPAIVLVQNDREMSHFFASKEFGFQNLGLGHKITDQDILDILKELVENYNIRKYMSDLMLQQDIKNSKKRVLNLINSTIDK